MRVVYDPSNPTSILRFEDWVVFEDRLVETTTGQVLFKNNMAGLSQPVSAPNG